MNAKVFVRRNGGEDSVVECVRELHGSVSTSEADVVTFVRAECHLPLGVPALKHSQLVSVSKTVIPISYWLVT